MVSILPLESAQGNLENQKFCMQFEVRVETQRPRKLGKD
jgi:hypothetical protein